MSGKNAKHCQRTLYTDMGPMSNVDVWTWDEGLGRAVRRSRKWLRQQLFAVRAIVSPHGSPPPSLSALSRSDMRPGNMRENELSVYIMGRHMAGRRGRNAAADVGRRRVGKAWARDWRPDPPMPRGAEGSARWRETMKTVAFTRLAEELNGGDRLPARGLQHSPYEADRAQWQRWSDDPVATIGWVVKHADHYLHDDELVLLHEMDPELVRSSALARVLPLLGRGDAAEAVRSDRARALTEAAGVLTEFQLDSTLSDADVDGDTFRFSGAGGGQPSELSRDQVLTALRSVSPETFSELCRIAMPNTRERLQELVPGRVARTLASRR